MDLFIIVVPELSSDCLQYSGLLQFHNEQIQTRNFPPKHITYHKKYD